jgi:N-carbamoylputrescine amidase
MLRLAMLTEVFFGEGGLDRLRELLRRARADGATMAVLPELPLNRWCPAFRDARAEDMEPQGGPRERLMAAAAKDCGIALVGGAIVADADGRRFNTAFLYDANGDTRTSYRKLHVPQEPGYWERSHYEPGDALPEIVDGLGIPLALQICSDVNRPTVSHGLGAAGAGLILVPRATPRETYERWRTVLRANALTSGTYVVSVNRPRPEFDVDIGGPSLAIGPDGGVLVETEDPLATVDLDPAVVERERREYPGYLDVRGDLYVSAWRRVAPREPSG